MKRTIFSLLFLLFSATFVFAQIPSWNWDESAPEDFGIRGEIPKILLETKDESKLLNIWHPDMEKDENILYFKMLAAKRLGLYGTKAAVPVLVPRLDNDQDGFYVRYALETIPGAEVDAALCEALKTNKKPGVLSGILTTLGVRGNSNSAAAVKPFLTHENAEVKKAAGYAYALTAGKDGDAFFINGQLDPLLADSGFLFAEQYRHQGNTAQAVKIYEALASTNIKEYQKMSAIYQSSLTLGLKSADLLFQQLAPGLPRKQFEVGLKAGQELPADRGGTVAKVLDKQFYAQTDQLRRAKMVLALGNRLDKESKAVVLPSIIELAKGKFPTVSGIPAGTDKTVSVAVRVAAIEALQNIGDASAVGALIEAANQTEEKSVADAARNTLATVPGKEVDDAICKLLEGNNPAVRVTAIKLVAERRIFSAASILINAIGDSNADVSGAAVAALGEISGIEDLPKLVGLLRQASSDEEAQKILNVLKSACTRFPQDAAATEVAKALEGSSTKLKTQLLELLMEIAGQKSLDIVNGFAWSDDAEMRDQATRILGRWRSPQDLDIVAAACLRLAKESEEYKVRNLSSYIRLARQFSMPEERRFSMCQEVLDLADRDEVRVMIFPVYERLDSVAALEKAAAHLDNPALQERAAEAAVVIGKKLQGRRPQAAKIMEDVIKTTKNDATRLQAEMVLAKLAGVDEGVEIVKAVYGANNQTADVTDKVRTASGGNTLIEIGSYNALFDDPAPSVVKTLKITYKIKGGAEKTVEFPENASIVLPK
ncbi:MAG: HEAT repeat domain-containing protein [Planctomycetaceae bacterium]|jgi:HEAT repeat protein|nr:HEAT repeat domain-containing protein [Planctomycetaceae bacterium]